ncbi:MAG: hypothetical protein QXV58_15115 [Saccharolobus sp.]|uniref:hypothetical protein n=1 Tax=Saccharolobus sp. TaxID=2100761 RepID=UPI0031629AF0
MARHKPKKTSKLIFPANWTGKWLYDAVVATPKWQVNSFLGAPQYAQWISYFDRINGLQLAPKTNADTNFMRSVQVGLVTSQIAQEYENTKVKQTLEDKAEELEKLLTMPIVNQVMNNTLAKIGNAPITVRQEVGE